MLVPSAGQPGLQFIVRPQAPVLTLQAQPGATAISASPTAVGKPLVRYVSQVPQITQVNINIFVVSSRNIGL